MERNLSAQLTAMNVSAYRDRIVEVYSEINSRIQPGVNDS